MAKVRTKDVVEAFDLELISGKKALTVQLLRVTFLVQD